MDKHINIADNIFVLNARIRMIRDLLLLDTDPELFLNKTLEDLDFIDATLISLFSILKESTRLIEKDEHFFYLAESERQFGELLSEFINGEGTISSALYPVLQGKIETLRKRSGERRGAIGKTAAEIKNTPAEPIVSYDELHELLSG
ncbi:MAG: hypothetical protein LBQ44_01940 [Treponema sp.]|jgi:hypothetical protein|nr:hypothetical protein [Treponema sp.]